MATTITLIGNLTRDPELRITRDGQSTTTLGVAVNRRWQDAETHEWEESTSYFDVVCWRSLAENAVVSLTRGVRVVVTGRLEQRAWEAADGERRTKVEVVAEDLGPSLRFATTEVQRVERVGTSRIGSRAGETLAPDTDGEAPGDERPARSRGGDQRSGDRSGRRRQSGHQGAEGEGSRIDGEPEVPATGEASARSAP